jgi:hypothetical protein
MKRVKVSLTGHFIQWASRTFVIEVSDEFCVDTLDQGALETLADDARIGWEFDTGGVVLATDHSVEDGTSVTNLPVIDFLGTPGQS